MTTYNIETHTMVSKETIFGTSRQIETARASDLEPKDILHFVAVAFNSPRAKGYVRTMHIENDTENDTVTVIIDDTPSKP